MFQLSKYLRGSDIVQCFAKGHGGCITMSLFLIVYRHDEMESKLFKLFKLLLNDTNGQIVERHEIKTVSRMTRYNLKERNDLDKGRVSMGACFDVKNGHVRVLLCGLGELIVSKLFSISF